jgi:hypothetical protein
MKILSGVVFAESDCYQRMAAKCEKLAEQYNLAKQEAAVANKEIEMLRELAKKRQ